MELVPLNSARPNVLAPLALVRILCHRMMLLNISAAPRASQRVRHNKDFEVLDSIWNMMRHPGLESRSLSCQGTGISAHCRARSAEANQNFNNLDGFIFALMLLLKSAVQSMIWAAPVCSSWTWINRSTSGRSAAYPMGRPDRETVQAGNQMMARTTHSKSLHVCRHVL